MTLDSAMTLNKEMSALVLADKVYPILQDVVYCAKGDVKISTREKLKMFLVHSVILGNCSPVFAAMFSGDYSETVGMSSATPKDIELDDESDEAMQMLLAAMHCREIDFKPVCKSVYHLWILHDKYQCTEAICPALAKMAAEVKTLTDLQYEVATCYNMGFESRLQHGLRELILNYDILDICSETEHGNVLCGEILKLIASRRKHIIDKIQRITVEVQWPIREACGCVFVPSRMTHSRNPYIDAIYELTTSPIKFGILRMRSALECIKWQRMVSCEGFQHKSIFVGVKAHLVESEVQDLSQLLDNLGDVDLEGWRK